LLKQGALAAAGKGGLDCVEIEEFLKLHLEPVSAGILRRTRWKRKVN
jgi:hypothetical protein